MTANGWFQIGLYLFVIFLRDETHRRFHDASV